MKTNVVLKNSTPVKLTIELNDTVEIEALARMLYRGERMVLRSSSKGSEEDRMLKEASLIMLESVKAELRRVVTTTIEESKTVTERLKVIKLYLVRQG